jgi:hypothetical protein
MIILLKHEITLTGCAQFPVKDVKELEAQLFAIQHELHEDRDPHEGKSAEEAYSERLNKLSLTEGGIQEGDVVVKALLARCLLWSEVIQEKYDAVVAISQNIPLTIPAGKERSTNDSRIPTTNLSSSATTSNR